MAGYKHDSLFYNGNAWTEPSLNALGKKIIEWAEGPTEYPTLTGFVIENPKEISITNLRNLKNRYPLFKEFCGDAEKILAAKMVKRSFEGKASPYILKTYVPMYDEEVRQHEDAREAYTAELQSHVAATQVLTMADLVKQSKTGELKQE